MSGRGTIDQRPSGRWRVRVTVDGVRKTLGLFEERDEAERVLNAYNREASAGAVLIGGVSFGALGLEWMTRRELSRRVRGIRQELAAWRAHVERAPFFATPIAIVRRADVADWV